MLLVESGEINPSYGSDYICKLWLQKDVKHTGYSDNYQEIDSKSSCFAECDAWTQKGT